MYAYYCVLCMRSAARYLMWSTAVGRPLSPNDHRGRCVPDFALRARLSRLGRRGHRTATICFHLPRHDVCLFVTFVSTSSGQCGQCADRPCAVVSTRAAGTILVGKGKTINTMNTPVTRRWAEFLQPGRSLWLCVCLQCTWAAAAWRSVGERTTRLRRAWVPRYCPHSTVVCWTGDRRRARQAPGQGRPSGKTRRHGDIAAVVGC